MMEIYIQRFVKGYKERNHWWNWCLQDMCLVMDSVGPRTLWMNEQSAGSPALRCCWQCSRIPPLLEDLVGWPDNQVGRACVFHRAHLSWWCLGDTKALPVALFRTRSVPGDPSTVSLLSGLPQWKGPRLPTITPLSRGESLLSNWSVYVNKSLAPLSSTWDTSAGSSQLRSNLTWLPHSPAYLSGPSCFHRSKEPSIKNILHNDLHVSPSPREPTLPQLSQ